MSSKRPYPSCAAAQTPLAPVKWSTSLFSSKWQPASLKPNTPTSTPSASRPSSLKVLTYNIWFNNLSLPHRWLAILSLFTEHSPDIICIQEATDSFINFLCNDPSARQRYIIVNGFVEGSWYGCLILVDKTKLDLVRATNVTFPTGMGRALTVVEVVGKKGVSSLPLVSNTPSPHPFHTPNIILPYSPASQPPTSNQCTIHPKLVPTNSA